VRHYPTKCSRKLSASHCISPHNSARTLLYRWWPDNSENQLFSIFFDPIGKNKKERGTMTMVIKVRPILVSVRPKTIATGPVTLLHHPGRPQQLQLLLLVASLCFSIKELHLLSSSRAHEQFPHPNHCHNCLTVLCCSSSFDGRQCTMNHCSCYHFPSNLSSVTRELKNWLNGQPLVEWHGEAIGWINPDTDCGTSPLSRSAELTAANFLFNN
jgi:hypothetical protein